MRRQKSAPSSNRWADSSSALSTSAALAASKILSNIALSVTAVLTARLLGPSARGMLTLVITAASLSMLLLTMGVALAGRLHLVSKDRVSLGEYLGLGIALTLLQGICCVALGLFLLPLANTRLGTLGILSLMSYGMIILGSQLLSGALLAYGYFAYASLSDMSAGIISLLVTSALVISDAREVPLYVISLATGPLIGSFIGLIVLRRKGHGIRPSYKRLAWTRLLRAGVPSLGLNVGQAAIFRIDRYLVGFFLSPAAVGLYSVAATAAELVRLPSFSLGQFLFHRLASGRLSNSGARQIYRMGMFILITLVVGMFFVSAPGVRLVFGNAYDGAIIPLQILLLGEIGVGSFLLDSFSLSGRNQIGKAANASLLSLLLVTVLDLLLIPKFGIAGAAWASVVGYSTMAVLARRTLTSLHRSHDDGEISQKRTPQIEK